MNNAFIKNRPKWLRYGVVVAGIHIVGVIMLFVNLKQYPQLLGFAFLAYTLGLRHAFDVDHIAAIDNTVRKMVQQKQDPMGVGFFFPWPFFSCLYYGHHNRGFYALGTTKYTTNTKCCRCDRNSCFWKFPSSHRAI